MKNLIISLVFLFSSPIFAQIKMAITVDDLPEHGKLPPGVSREQITREMLRIFKKHDVPDAVGFINAEKGLIDLLKMWRAAGYSLGNHTYSHLSINKGTISEYKKEIDGNEGILQELAGDSPWKVFRYPYLHEGNSIEKRNAIRAYLKERGYKIAQVTVDFEEWAWNDPYAMCMLHENAIEIEWLKKTFMQNAQEVLERSELLSQKLFNRSIKHILLLHIGGFTTEMLDELLSLYKKKGVEFIPLSEALTDPVYELDPGVVSLHGSELQYQVLKSRGLTLQDIGMKPYEGFPWKKLKNVCLKDFRRPSQDVK